MAAPSVYILFLDVAAVREHILAHPYVAKWNNAAGGETETLRARSIVGFDTMLCFKSRTDPLLLRKAVVRWIQDAEHASGCRVGRTQYILSQVGDAGTLGRDPSAFPVSLPPRVKGH